MAKKEIKEVEPSMRIEIIHNNFFKLLNLNKISQKKYSEDNNVPESTISKWKKGSDASMNEEHIIQAAKYFNVSVNRLYYTEQELKELKVKDDVTYVPIMAQQHIEVKLLSESFKNPGDIVFGTTLFSVVLAIMTYFYVIFIHRWCLLLALIIPFVGRYFLKSDFGISKMYSINYLDDVYYQIKDTQNQYIKYIRIIRIVKIMISFILLILLIPFKSVSSNSINIRSILVLMLFIYSIVSLITYLYKQKELKKKIYASELDGYYIGLFNFYLSLVCSVFLIGMLCEDIKSNWFYLIFMIIIPMISFIEFRLISKKYSEYKLVYYNQKDNEVRELFVDVEEK